MSYDFTADEVFEMAIRIEENGAAFYRKAAGFQKDPADKAFLEDLARMEDKHKAGFEGMKGLVAEAQKAQTVFDPEEEMGLYLAAMADSHGGEGDPKVLESFSGEETIEEIIATAIGLEKESILFYLGIKEMVPDKFGKGKIDEIIREEQRHVAQLNAFLKKAVK